MRLGAILVGILPLVLLEAGLRFFDLGRPTSQADPLHGFSRQQPLFEPVRGVYRTVRWRESFFNPQEFAAEKPAHGFRVFCFGGSTVYGHPYRSDTAFPKWLELELAGTDPSRPVEVVNCGGISYASYRLALIVQEVLHYQPDLIIVATGENEFLEDRTYQSIKARSGFRRWFEDKVFSLRTATCALRLIRPDRRSDSGTQDYDSGRPQLAPEVTARLDNERSGYASYHRDEAWHREVVRQFEDAMRKMIEDCRVAKVPLLLATLGSNLRDCPPYKAEHKTGLAPGDETRWQLAFDGATAAEKDDLNTALELYRKAEAIDDEHALLAFRMARCLDRLGQLDRAREYYLRAKDQDICPLRMLDQVYQLQLSLAAESNLPLVDVRKLLESVSPDGIPGNNIYLDHVHPTLGGDQMIARAIAGKIRELQIFSSAGHWSAEARRTAYHRHFQHFEVNYFTNGRRRVEWLENWARRQRLYQETLPGDARGFLDQGYRYLDFAEVEQACKSFEAALQRDPGTAKKLVNHALELRDQGRPESARQLLDWLSGVVPDREVKGEIDKASQLLLGDLTVRKEDPTQ